MMNISEHISSTQVGGPNPGRGAEGSKPASTVAGTPAFLARLAGRFVTACSRASQPKSILRNQTNLPAFVLIALGLSLLCNITLRQSSAEASRPIGSSVSLEQMLNLVRQNPDDYELHTQLGERYFEQREYRRAMFHLAEASRLIERSGD